MTIKIITPKELHTKLNEVCLIDVREPEEHREGYIEGAYLVPLATVSLQRIRDILGSSKQPVMFYCRAGKRSLSACEKVLQEDADFEVASMEGGILAWQSAGFIIKKD